MWDRFGWVRDGSGRVRLGPIGSGGSCRVGYVRSDWIGSGGLGGGEGAVELAFWMGRGPISIRRFQNGDGKIDPLDTTGDGLIDSKAIPGGEANKGALPFEFVVWLVCLLSDAPTPVSPSRTLYRCVCVPSATGSFMRK